jgi:hypothetical protein
VKSIFGRLRSLVLLFIVAALCAATTGCALFKSPDKAFVTGVNAYAVDSGLLDEYDKYVDADPNLKPESKKIRHDSATGLRKIIKDAQAR